MSDSHAIYFEIIKRPDEKAYLLKVEIPLKINDSIFTYLGQEKARGISFDDLHEIVIMAKKIQDKLYEVEHKIICCIPPYGRHSVEVNGEVRDEL